jgi:hypothetical protein
MAAENYITRAQFQASKTLTDTTFANEDIDRVIAAASRDIEDATGRKFYIADPTNDETRYFSPIEPNVLDIDDLATCTSVKLDCDGDGTAETALTRNTDYVLEPLNAASDDAPYDRLRIHPRGSHPLPVEYPRSVEIVGIFGWETVPSKIEMACLLLAGRYLTRGRSAPLGVVGLGPEGAAVRILRTDPDVYQLLQSFIRPLVA